MVKEGWAPFFLAPSVFFFQAEDGGVFSPTVEPKLQWPKMLNTLCAIGLLRQFFLADGNCVNQQVFQAG